MGAILKKASCLTFCVLLGVLQNLQEHHFEHVDVLLLFLDQPFPGLYFMVYVTRIIQHVSRWLTIPRGPIWTWGCYGQMVCILFIRTPAQSPIVSGSGDSGLEPCIVIGFIDFVVRWMFSYDGLLPLIDHIQCYDYGIHRRSWFFAFEHVSSWGCLILLQLIG